MDSPQHTVALSAALRAMARHPLVLLRDWNWKAAAFSAVLRSIIILIGNHRASHRAMGVAVATELLYSTFAAGVAGTVTQRLRHAEPERQTRWIVWLWLPALITAAQFAVHRATGTPHLRGSLIASFIFSSLASGFNWFSMRRGAFVTGADRSFARDLLLVPKLIVQFITAPLRRV